MNGNNYFKFVLRNKDYGFSPDAIIKVPHNNRDEFEMCEIVQEKIDDARRKSPYGLVDSDIDEICRENGWRVVWLDPIEIYDGLLEW